MAVLIASICLSIANLSDDTSAAIVEEATASSIFILRMTMTVIPIAGLLLAAFLFRRKYILTEQKVEEIAAQIKRKQN